MPDEVHNQPQGAKDTPPAKSARYRSHSKQRLQWDDVIVVFFALLGFAGSVVLYATGSAPPIIISVFLATGISSLVYRYLGGIEVTAFAWGTLRVGGTLAALLGISVGVNRYLEVQSLAMLSLPGRYEWQYGAGGWKGYVNVDEDGSTSVYMQRYTTCGGVLKSLPLLQQDGLGKVEPARGKNGMHIRIPVRFINYDANCNPTGLADQTILSGDLVRTPAFAGTVEYRNKYGVPLGGMVLVKDHPGTFQ